MNASLDLQTPDSTTLDTLREKMPPGSRDFDVFQRVVVEGGTTRAVALEFKLSQTRVCQLLGRVRAWLRAVEPAGDLRQTSEAELNLARRLAADRLEFLYGKAVEGWRNSGGEVTRIRSSPTGERSKTTTVSQGDPKYLLAAMRIATACSKLPLGILDTAFAVAELDEEAEELSDRVEQAAVAGSASAAKPAPIHATPPNNHPEGACSGNAERGRRKVDMGAASCIATRSDATTSGGPAKAQEQARREFFAPVQAASARDLAAEVRALRANGTAVPLPSLGSRSAP